MAAGSGGTGRGHTGRPRAGSRPSGPENISCLVRARAPAAGAKDRQQRPVDRGRRGWPPGSRASPGGQVLRAVPPAPGQRRRRSHADSGRSPCSIRVGGCSALLAGRSAALTRPRRCRLCGQPTMRSMTSTRVEERAVHVGRRPRPWSVARWPGPSRSGRARAATAAPWPGPSHPPPRRAGGAGVGVGAQVDLDLGCGQTTEPMSRPSTTMPPATDRLTLGGRRAAGCGLRGRR